MSDAVIGRLPADLLGRHVADRAEDHARLGAAASARRRPAAAVRSRLRQLRQAEVEDLDAPVRRDEDVLRLQIAVDDALRRARPRGRARSATA